MGIQRRGPSKFSEEIPSFAIRNLVISDMNQQINFPLNESSGILVHDKQGKIRGKAINPIWLINKSYYWNLLHSQASESTAGYNYDFNSGNFVYFNSDSLYTLDIRRKYFQGSSHAAGGQDGLPQLLHSLTGTQAGEQLPGPGRAGYGGNAPLILVLDLVPVFADGGIGPLLGLWPSSPD